MCAGVRCMHALMHVCVCMGVHECTCVGVPECTCAGVQCMYVCLHACVCVCICAVHMYDPYMHSCFHARVNECAWVCGCLRYVCACTCALMPLCVHAYVGVHEYTRAGVQCMYVCMRVCAHTCHAYVRFMHAFMFSCRCGCLRYVCACTCALVPLCVRACVLGREWMWGKQSYKASDPDPRSCPLGGRADRDPRWRGRGGAQGRVGTHVQ